MFECVTCVAMHLNNICMYCIGPAMTVSETTACNNVIISKLTTHGSEPVVESTDRKYPFVFACQWQLKFKKNIYS